jgi:hypothetical protein
MSVGSRNLHGLGADLVEFPASHSREVWVSTCRLQEDGGNARAHTPLPVGLYNGSG